MELLDRLLIGFIIIFFLTFFIYFTWTTIGGQIIYKTNSDCFKKTAEDFCNKEGKIFEDSWCVGFNCRFKCLDKERLVEGVEYKFTEEEIERCLG